MIPLSLLLLLLPIAFVSGWWLAQRFNTKRSHTRVNALASDYFRGLNYLLNEEQDKAIEVFLRLVEYDHDTVETHLALGKLFRRRGEVDRAIRLHQHLLSRSDLNPSIKNFALLNLAEDYMCAGLFDRAEALFSDLVAMESHAPSALKHLIALYQQERDWHHAITYAKQLEALTGEDYSDIIAQFYCELAEEAIQHKNTPADAHAWLQKAFSCQRKCARAYMLRGHLHASDKCWHQAIDAYEHAIHVDVSLIPEILLPLLDNYAHANQIQRGEQFLSNMLLHYQGISLTLALTNLYRKRDGNDQANTFLTKQLRQRPSIHGLLALSDATMGEIHGDMRENLLILRELAKKNAGGAVDIPLPLLWICYQGTSLAMRYLQAMEYHPSHPGSAP